jgi:SagB-type dehydrogenase family enzyme
MINKGRKKKILILAGAFISVLLFFTTASCSIIQQAGSYIRYSLFRQTGEIKENDPEIRIEGEEIILPEPETSEGIPVEAAMEKRRSVRAFSEKELEIEKISQLLWAAQGITQGSTGYRTAPSAGALYPLELFLVKSDGVYNYRPLDHKLIKTMSRDIRTELAEGSAFQGFIATAPASIVMAGVFERTTQKYGQRGLRYVYMEAGHSCQNILLQAVSLGLCAVPVGAFDDDYLQNLLSLPPEYEILYVVPVGYPQ